MPRKKKATVVQVTFPNAADKPAEASVFTPRILRVALNRCYDDGFLQRGSETATAADRLAIDIEHQLYREPMSVHPEEPLTEREMQVLARALQQLTDLIDPSRMHFANFGDFLHYGSDVVEHEEREREAVRQTQEDLRRQETTEPFPDQIIDEFFRFLLPEAIQEVRQKAVVTVDHEDQIEVRLNQIREYIKRELGERNRLYNPLSEGQARDLTFLLEDVRNICIEAVGRQQDARMPEANLRLFLRRAGELIPPAEPTLPPEAEPEKVIPFPLGRGKNK